MEELANTVSDILNQASSGVGDISEWLASDGLSGYAAVSTAQSAYGVAAAVVILIACTAGIIHLARACNNGDIDCDAGVFIFALAIIAAIAALFAIMESYKLIGWLVSPDGMLLKEFVSAVGN